MTTELTVRRVAEMVEFGEAAAYEDLFQHAPPELGLSVMHSGGAVLLIAPSLPIILFNRVIGLGLRGPVTEPELDEILARYRAAGSATFAAQLSPRAAPGDLPAWLHARGLSLRDNWAKVYRAAAPDVIVRTDLRVERIDRAHAAAFAEVSCTAFGMPAVLQPWLAAGVGRPGWSHYLAFDGETPVAGGALFVEGNVGWLGIASTLPAHRRRGAQGALMARRIRDASELGCRWVVTETGEDTPEHPNPSYRNMLRTGFLLAYHRPNYIAQA
jgi:GNAT superfamily N-acetyltransferase